MNIKGLVGAERITQTGIVGVAFTPIFLYGYFIVNSGVAIDVTFVDGNGAEIYIEVFNVSIGAASSKKFAFGTGILFPNGLFIDGRSTDFTTVLYKQART